MIEDAHADASRLDALIGAAHAARERADVPYSTLAMGAAVLTDAGAVAAGVPSSRRPCR